jgi:hypothetical protein
MTVVPSKRLIEECNLSYYALSCAEQVENVHEPATYKEAIRCADSENWISAMHEEMQSLEKNSTWEVVPLPKKKKNITSGSSREMRVYLQASLQSIRQG